MSSTRKTLAAMLGIMSAIGSTNSNVKPEKSNFTIKNLSRKDVKGIILLGQVSGI